MALLADGLCATLQDLAIHDSSVLSVASTEGIDVTGKLTLVHDTIFCELSALLNGESTDRVVITGALKALHVYSALEQIYRDAFNSQLNDRYEGRWRQYERMRREAWRSLLEAGVGLVEVPAPKAEPPLLTRVPSAGPSGTLYARVAWLNSRGEEGSPSECSSAAIDPGEALKVQAVSRPATASGWNVFVGEGPDETKQQNEAPIAIDAAWVQTVDLNAGGRPPGNGQAASVLRTVPRVLRRG